jgi:hypothetical protein
MKKTIFICLMIFAINVSAKEWESYWISALEAYGNEDFLSSELDFNLSINLMEEENDQDYPVIYADRARLLLILNKYEEALVDVNRALKSENLKGRERARAISARIVAKAKLGIIEGNKEDLIYLANNFETHVENTTKYVIIRNMPKCQTTRESVADYFVHAGICLNKEDIKILPSDICIIKKAYRLKNDCENCYNKQLLINPLTVTSCRLWCDNNAITAIAWCINYPEFRLVNACNNAILLIQNNCRTCCQQGFAQDFCAAPFGDILNVMQIILSTTPCCGCQMKSNPPDLN